LAVSNPGHGVRGKVDIAGLAFFEATDHWILQDKRQEALQLGVMVAVALKIIQ
jgi:hypothetical protein